MRKIIIKRERKEASQFRRCIGLWQQQSLQSNRNEQAIKSLNKNI